MTARPKRTPRTCDAPGCTATVRRGVLMCRDHWFRLPRVLRDAIKSAWSDRRMSEWSANCLEARSYLAQAREPAASMSAQQSYALQQRMLGERDEA